MLLVHICSAVVCACGSLQPAHTESVKAFAKAAKMMSAVPGELYGGVARYRHQLKMVEVSTVHRPEKLVEELDKVAVLNRRFQQTAAQVHASMALVDVYAQALLTLTDEGYAKAVGKGGTDLGLQLHTALSTYNKLLGRNLPPSVGDFIGGVVARIGSAKLRRLQKKHLRSFVDSGAVLVTAVCDYYTGTVAGTLQVELSSLSKGLTNVMTHFYATVYEYQKAQNVNAFDYLKLYNPLYMQMKEELEDLHQLQSKAAVAMEGLKAAHRSLQGVVDGAVPGRLTAEVKELHAAATELRGLLNKK